MKPDALLSFFKESLILRRDDSLQFVAFINKKLYTKRKIGRSGKEKLVEAVTEAYDIDSATARKDIRSFTETLEKNGILER